VGESPQSVKGDSPWESIMEQQGGARESIRKAAFRLGLGRVYSNKGSKTVRRGVDLSGGSRKKMWSSSWQTRRGYQEAQAR